MAVRRRIIDLDANASTPLDKRVFEVMTKTYETVWGNPSSDHLLGTQAADLVERSRLKVAQLIDAEPSEIIFTSGATEAINLAILGLLGMTKICPAHIITTKTEHPAVLQTIDYAHRKYGVEVTSLQPDSFGRVSPNQIEKSLRDTTVLVALIHGNNEIGTINPIEKIANILQDHPAVFFTDTAQTLGYLPISTKTGIDMLAISGHKMYGPKGIGALYIKRGLRIAPLMHGGGQERSLRPGTINTPLVVALGKAAELARQERTERTKLLTKRREDFFSYLKNAIPDIHLNGDPVDRLPNNLNMFIPCVEAFRLRKELPELAFSQGSACSSGKTLASHVLHAIGLNELQQAWTIRVGIGLHVTYEDLMYAAGIIKNAVYKIKGTTFESID